MTDVKRRVNRAVAALTEATGEYAFLSTSPLINTHVPSEEEKKTTSRPVVRYENYSQLLEARVRKDPFTDLRQAIEGLQERPKPRDEARALESSVWLRVFAYLDMPSQAILARCNRPLRLLSLTAVKHTAIDVVPAMVSLERLSDPDVMASLISYFDRHTRGQHVSQFACVGSAYDAMLPLSKPLPRVDLLAALRLCTQLPMLRQLDLRGVRWDCNPAAAALFLTDLHLVVPQIEELKIGADLYAHWSDGWWRRHRCLSLLGVASRRQQPVPPPAPAGSDERAPPATSIKLHEDLLAMLSAEGRSWRLKLWAPVDPASLRQLLLPAGCHTNLVELTVNALGNETLFEGVEAPAEPESGKKAKGKKPAAGEVVTTLSLPRLTTFTVANLDTHVSSASEWFAKVSRNAPHLVNFNVCNTGRLPPEANPKRKKRVAANN